MAKDVAELKSLNQALHNQCVIEETDRGQLTGDLRPYSNDVVGYRISFCRVTICQQNQINSNEQVEILNFSHAGIE